MKKIKRTGYIISILFALMILFLSTYPTDNSNTNVFIFKGMDKVIHAIMYFVLIVLLLRDYLRQNSFKIKAIVFFVLGTIFYSIMMEIIQHYFIASRSGECLDIVANTIGIIAGTLFIYLINKRRSS